MKQQSTFLPGPYAEAEKEGGHPEQQKFAGPDA